MKTKFLAGAVCAFALSGVAYADTTVNVYGDLDADSDGWVSESEARANTGLSTRFGDLDINGDGRLDEPEFSKFEAGADVEVQTPGGGVGVKTPAGSMDTETDVEADIETETEVE
jgi:hypothetical protein